MDWKTFGRKHVGSNLRSYTSMCLGENHEFSHSGLQIAEKRFASGTSLYRAGAIIV
jgi:hypothetical protein